MKAEAVTAIVKGLKEAGIDFVVTLPCTGNTSVIPQIMRDPHFKHITVGNEGDGMLICAGAGQGAFVACFD